MNVIKSLSFLIMFFLVSELTAGSSLRSSHRITTTKINMKVHSVSLYYGSVVIKGEIESGSLSASTQDIYSNGTGAASEVVDRALDWRGIVRVASNRNIKAPDGCLSLAIQAAALGKSISIIDVVDKQLYPIRNDLMIGRDREPGIDYYLDNLRDCTLSFK